MHIQKEDCWVGGRAGLEYFGKEELLFPVHGIELMTARPLAWPMRRLRCSVSALTADLKRICHLLALLRARHIIHISWLTL